MCKAKFFLNGRILCDVSLQLILPFNVPKVCKGYGEATQKSSSMMTLSKGNGMLRWRHLELNVEIKKRYKLRSILNLTQLWYATTKWKQTILKGTLANNIDNKKNETLMARTSDLGRSMMALLKFQPCAKDTASSKSQHAPPALV